MGFITSAEREVKVSRRSGPSCSKLGLDNPGLVRDLNSDLKA